MHIHIYIYICICIYIYISPPPPSPPHRLSVVVFLRAGRGASKSRGDVGTASINVVEPRGLRVEGLGFRA